MDSEESVYKNKAESLKKEYINTLTAYKTGLESNRTLLSSGKDQKIPPSTATHHRASQNQILMKVPPNHFNREQVSQQAQVQKVIPVKMAPSGDSASPAVVPDCAVQQQLNQSNVCIRRGCTNLPVSNPQWENEYCSVECVLSHCREVYNSWVKLHRDKTNKFSSLK